MAYKTRKTNKRRYLQKRKSRRMYGGEGNDIIVEEKKEEVPTLMSNLEDSGNLLMSETSNLAAKGIQSTAETLGIDPNISAQDNINKIGDNLENISEALNSPEGEKLKEETSKLLADSLEVLEPSIKKAENIAKDSLIKLGNTGTGILVTAMNAIPPIFLISETSKFATAAAQAGEAVAELTTTGTEAIEKMEGKKKEWNSLWERGTNMFNNISTNINKSVSDKIASAQESVNKTGKQIMESNMPKVEMPQLDSSVGVTDESMKKIQNDVKMIGGRVRKSQFEFLAPHVNRTQILRQYGGKSQSKRRQKNRRQISRRR
jgi:hypothetical protein